MNEKLEAQLRQIAGADQSIEHWRQQGQYWALFFHGRQGRRPR